MTLQVRFVQNLSQIVDPVADYLGRDIESLDLFEVQHVVVPTAGVRAWLVPQLARRLGASSARGDGIVSNVRFGYVGALNALLRNGIDDDSDAWSIDHITMAVLRVISNDARYGWLVKKYRGPLRAARAVADRFDRYAARRPQMIRAWERGSMMIPGVNVADTEAVQRFAWQYELWREVRTVIGVPSWPARSEQLIAELNHGVAIPGLPRRLMVAGLESISASNLEVLAALGNVIDVEALFVHPSPALRELWAQRETSYMNEEAEVPKRDDDFVTPDVDVLVSTWTRGSFELQMLLASQGLSATHMLSETHVNRDDLLNRLQRAVAEPSTVHKSTHLDSDHSVQIHRAHNLARQIEVLRDALLHAFTDIPDLQPHEVLVLCADVEAAAPLLQATFERSVTLSDGRKVKIPFVVADRSLRDVSSGAELLDDVLSLARSRFDVNSVMKVATASLVLDNFNLDDSDVAAWMRYTDLTRVRWGLDTEHRAAHKLKAPSISAHSWQHALERALLGALVPNREAAIELGGVVPLTHVEVADVSSISGLIGILSPLVALESATRAPRAVAEWCDLLEGTLLGLCGESCVGIDDALDVLTQFRRATVLEHETDVQHFSDAVTFDEFADLIGQLITTTPGRQPLRTGAVTATSFVPLRAVPFRVVCVVGLDDGTLPSGDVEGDDLVAIEAMMGDSDPRLETRRVLLDAVLAAGDRLIITCNGRSIKNNSAVPLVTPLAELVDLSVRLGVAEPTEPSFMSGIERLHPRHSSGEANFIDGEHAVVSGRVWSHDVAARTAAEKMNQEETVEIASVVTLAEATRVISMKSVEDLYRDPLRYYLERTLKVYKEYDDDESATLPTTPKKFGVENAAKRLDDLLFENSSDDVLAKWRTEVRASEILPVEPFAESCLDDAKKIATAIHDARVKENLTNLRSEEVALHVGGGFVLEGHIDGVCDDAQVLSSLLYQVKWEHERPKMALRLLVLCATGSPIRRGLIVHVLKSNKPQVRVIELDASVTKESATSALRRFVEAENVARTIPCPLFGDTAKFVFGPNADADAALGAFDNKTGFGFKDSYECLVFGGNPVFSDVYESRPELMKKFFDSYFGLLTIEDKEGVWTVAQ